MKPEAFVNSIINLLGEDSVAKASHLPIRIGIVGAGPAGLMTALALEAYAADANISVTILDRNASATDYPGVEYGIQERACRALERIGQLESALKRGNCCTEIAFYNARLRKRFRSISPNPHYTRSVVRQEFLADLGDLLQRTPIKRRHMVTAMRPGSDGSVTVEGHRETEDQTFSHRFDLVVAAEGVNSVARKALFPDQAEIHDRGFSCIYMLVEGTPQTAPPGFLERANSGRSELIMGSISTMTMFPLGQGRLALGIGFDHKVKAQLWARNKLAMDLPWANIPSATKKAIALELVADVSEDDDRLIKALELVPDWDSYKIYVWAMRDTDPLPLPYSTDGKIILIGDAAHALMPTIGMGASLAIEDAEQLARLIADAAKLTPEPAAFRAGLANSVFQPFTSARHPVWTELMGRARTAAIGNFINVKDKKRFAIGPQIPNNTISRLITAAEWMMTKLRL